MHELNNTVFTFYGPPGSGKGTLARKCSEALGFEVLSTGDLCRKHISECTDIGHKVKSIISSGHLIPDALITTMVKGWLEEKISLNKPIILDGYPRNASQHKLFVELYEDAGYSFKFRVILFEMPDDLIVERLTNRKVCSNTDCQAVYSTSTMPSDGKCSKCGSNIITRDDDKEEVIRERLKQYAGHKDALLKSYKDAGQLVEHIDVSKHSREEVVEEFKRIL